MSERNEPRLRRREVESAARWAILRRGRSYVILYCNGGTPKLETIGPSRQDAVRALEQHLGPGTIAKEHRNEQVQRRRSPLSR